jgi:hypothetical protein
MTSTGDQGHSRVLGAEAGVREHLPPLDTAHLRRCHAFFLH